MLTREIDIVADDNGFEVGMIVVDTFDLDEPIEYEPWPDDDDPYPSDPDTRYC